MTGPGAGGTVTAQGNTPISMTWYYAEGTTQLGPVSDEDFRGLVQSGAIRPETLVWRQGMAGWQPCREAAPVGAVAPPIPGSPTWAGGDTGVCVECGRVFPRKDMVTYAGQQVCASCRDVFFQKVREGVEGPVQMRYAGFWIRFGAWMIDYIVLMVANMVVQIPLSLAITAAVASNPEDPAAIGVVLVLYLVMTVLQMGIWIGYKTFFVGKFGATPGKMAVSLKIVRADGTPLTYGRAVGRAFAEMLSGLTFMIGYIMAGLDEEKRSLHDRVCDTRVIRSS